MRGVVRVAAAFADEAAVATSAASRTSAGVLADGMDGDPSQEGFLRAGGCADHAAGCSTILGAVDSPGMGAAADPDGDLRIYIGSGYGDPALHQRGDALFAVRSHPHRVLHACWPAAVFHLCQRRAELLLPSAHAAHPAPESRC